ncbi:SRPBCC family protein [Amycolatopsis sp. NPDC059027]|uniref:SRPBCC family protein n=1 Tax=unclassified Amycolatopsis TaxID=2618356 RepID=UPI00366E27E9
MKYSDCPSAEVEIRIAASPEHVWSWLIDVDLPSRFSAEFKGGYWLDDAGPGLGARFRGRNSHPYAGEWETTSTVVGFEPGRLFAWAVEDVDNPAGTWRFELIPDGDGTLLRQRGQMGPGPSNLTDIIAKMPEREEQLVAMRIEEFRTNMRATVEGIKALAEAGPREENVGAAG